MAMLFLVRDDKSEPLVVAYLDDDWRFWEWAPPTGRFHLADWLTHDYFGPTPELRYDELGLDAARGWIEQGVGRTQPRFARRFSKDLDAGRWLDPAAVLSGHVIPDDSARERARRRAAEARQRPGWVVYRTYPASARANAYAAANQIRSGRIKALPPDEFEAKSHRAEDGDYVVFIRSRPSAQVGPSHAHARAIDTG